MTQLIKLIIHIMFTLNDFIGLGMIGVIVICSVVVSFYFYVIYSHPLDKDFVGVWVFRCIIIIGQTIGFVMMFILPVDLLSTYKM